MVEYSGADISFSQCDSESIEWKLYASINPLKSKIISLELYKQKWNFISSIFERIERWDSLFAFSNIDRSQLNSHNS